MKYIARKLFETLDVGYATAYYMCIDRYERVKRYILCTHHRGDCCRSAADVICAHRVIIVIQYEYLPIVNNI